MDDKITLKIGVRRIAKFTEKEIKTVKRILFQGDSITDAGRSRENDEWKGRGYATLVSAKLGFDEPNQYEFFNRGIGGNRSVDLLARIKSDVINLKPDVMSILIGVNDVWHEVDFSKRRGCGNIRNILQYDNRTDKKGAAEH